MARKKFSRRTLLGGAVAGGVASSVAADGAAVEEAPPLVAAGNRATMAPGHLLRASAITTVGDRWLPDGTHLRVNVAPRLGFPLHPFTAFRIDVAPWHDSDTGVLVLSRKHVWLNADLTETGVPGGLIQHTTATDLHYLVIQGWQEDPTPFRCCFVRLVTGDGSAFRVDVLDPATALPDEEPRVLATRTAPPYEFGGADLTLLRVQGRGTVGRIEIINAESPAVAPDPARAVSLGLPTGARPWYVPDPATSPADAARTRVEQGAARRMGPPDRPDGTVVALTPADEVNRVAALSSAASGLDYWLTRSFTDQDKPPVDATVSLAGGPVAAASGSIAPLSALLAAAVDPAVARHLGLATRVDPPPSSSACTLWLVAGLWLLPLDRQHEGGTLRSLLTIPPTTYFLSWLYTRYPGLQALATQRQAQLRSAHPEDAWTAMPLITATVAARTAPDEPAPPRTLDLPPGTWRVTSGDRLWTQRIPLRGPAAGGMLGFARLTPGTPTSLHRTIRVGSVDRARAMIAHWDKHANDAGMVADLAVPAQSASWGLWRADEFGRWGGQTKVTGQVPPAAGPPAPSVEAEFQPAAPTTSLDPRSPGTLRIRVGVPGMLASQEVTGPGGSRVTSALLTVDGTPRSALPVPAGATSVVTTVPVRAFGVGDTAAIPVIARLADAAGLTSAPAQVDRTVHDPRALPPRKTAPTLLFASPRDPMGDSEIGLEWNSYGVWGYRVYLGDERRLGGTAPGRRCVRAEAVWARSDQLTDRRRFTLVTPRPLRPGQDGVVRFTHRLPGSLRNVQFVRVVPVTSAGVETPFETCGLTPIAVPAPDRPPAPVVRASPRSDGRVNVDITVTGVRNDLLPGPPEARLRRGRLPNSDPEYVPVVQTGIPLTRDGEGAWSATVVDGPPAGFPAFVRMTWLAEVRYPAEPHLLPPGTPAADSEIGPIAGAVPGEQMSAWGPTSPPASTLLTPENQLVPLAAVYPSPSSNQITVTNTPVSHRHAIAPHRVVVHRLQPGTGPSVTLPPVPITEITTRVFDTGFGPGPVSYLVVIVDPLNRPTTPILIA